MDLAQHTLAYNRLPAQHSGMETPQREAEADQNQQQHFHQQQQQQYQIPFAFSAEAAPSPQVDGLPFSALSSNLFVQQPAVNKIGSNGKQEARVDNEEAEQSSQQDQDFRRQLAQSESWQGDWSAVPPLDCSVSAGMVPVSKPSLDGLTPTNSLLPAMMTDDNARLEGQGLIEANTPAPRLIDPFSAKHGLPPMPMSAGGMLTTRNLEHYGNIGLQESYTIAENGLSSHHSFAQPGADEGTHQQRTALVTPLQCPPRSAPPTMLAYPQSVLAHSRPPPQVSIFSFRPEEGTGEIGWAVDKTSAQFQATPLLNGKVKFPTRPLHPGVLAKVHNEWLDEYPEPMPEQNGPIRMGEEWMGPMPSTKRFPTPMGTFESQHVRTLWQELERRRILEVSDAEHLRRLRVEAMHMIKLETAHRASAGANGLSQQELFNTIPDPPEEHVNHKARILWEQTKKSAVYAVGLLRQAEYCIAQGHLGFMPLNHNRGAQQQQAEHQRQAPAQQRTQGMAAFIPEPQMEVSNQAASRRGNPKQLTEQETAA